MNIRNHNCNAWNRQVEFNNPWTVPVSSQVIEAARNGEWHIILTPTIPVPQAWFPDLNGAQVLCLASGGGQQGPVLAAAGADVIVYDNSPAQLARDRQVAERDGLILDTVEGDMRDLSVFKDASFDLIIHPVSNTFVPDIRPVWREAYRVLRPGCSLLSGFDNPVLHIFNEAAYDRGELNVTRSLPYSDAESLSKEEITRRAAAGSPLEFGHTLYDQIGGQIAAGFIITDFYEDRCSPEDNDLLSKYMPTFIATRADKPAGT
jgi:SAM-dependent methyltransferase